MAELHPLPFDHLVRRMFREFEKQRKIFDLPAQKFYRSNGGPDTSVHFCGMKAATPVGPAAGPQTQMAQNLVLSWLGGGRIMELKTIQILDQLKIARPCIDMTNVGYNVEWSQELRLEQSLREYVVGHMLIEMLIAANVLEQSDPLAKTETIFDVSVGYDLKGIQSQPVRDWLCAIKDATPLVEQLRQEIPAEFSKYRDLPFKTKLAQSATLSTFHGCPADEIESIVHFLLTEMDYHVIIKMNPPMLGREKLEYLLHDRLGYHDLEVNPKVYEGNITFDEAVEVVRRLQGTADRLGKTIGVKFSNTLEVINKGKFFSDKIMYLSGPPLHALALALVEDWRKVFGAEIPISFSAGIDQFNVADAVAVNLVPITTCTDLLKPGGYGRLHKYVLNLEKKMSERNAECIDDYILKWGDDLEPALEQAAPHWQSLLHQSGYAEESSSVETLSRNLQTGIRSRFAREPMDIQKIIADELQKLLAVPQAAASTKDTPQISQLAEAMHRRLVELAGVLNTTTLMNKVLEEPRYRSANNQSRPRKIDSHLALFDCINCDKCIPVCPNDANFYYELQPLHIDYSNYLLGPNGIDEIAGGTVHIEKSHQIANYADFCNDCGNCDVFCPEHGGPYIKKPRFFSSKSAWQKHAGHNGFFIAREDNVQRLFGRIDDCDYELCIDVKSNRAVFRDYAIEVELEVPEDARPVNSLTPQRAKALQPEALGHVLDMGNCYRMVALLQGVTKSDTVNYVNLANEN